MQSITLLEFSLHNYNWGLRTWPLKAGHRYKFVSVRAGNNARRLCLLPNITEKIINLEE